LYPYTLIPLYLSLPFLFHRLNQSLDIPDSKQCSEFTITRMFIAVARNSGHMIGTHRTIESNFEIGLHRAVHVRFSLVVEGFLKTQPVAADIAEVDKENLVSFAEIPDYRRYVFAHGGEGTLAECKAVVGTWNNFYESFERVGRAHNA